MRKFLLRGNEVQFRMVVPFVVCLAACLITSAFAADDAAAKKDLFTVLALKGLPCGEVVSVATRAENDHIASCKDGNRYHIFINPEGRVIVEKQ
jgi:hypothetical protein